MLQPWASEQPSFDSELQRLVQFITNTEVYTINAYLLHLSLDFLHSSVFRIA